METTGDPMKKLFTPTLLILCLLLIPLPARAELTIGGDLRTEFSYAINSEAASLYDSGVDKGYTALTIFDAIDSVMEVNWQSSDKKYRAFVKFGVEGQAVGNAMETKQTWFQYQAEKWILRFGQAPTIIARSWPNQQLNGALGLDGYGKVHLERTQQIRLMYGQTHRLLLALEAPYKSGVWSGGRSMHYLPGLAVSAELNFGPVMVHPWARWELVLWEDNTGSDSYSSVDAGLDLSGDFGLIGFIVSVGYGLNSAQANPVISGDPFMVANRVEDDVTQFSVYGELRIGSLFIGGGYAKAERNDWTGSPYTASAFVNYVIPLGPMEFIPEVVWFDNGEDGTGADRGDVVFAGLAVHMPF